MVGDASEEMLRRFTFTVPPSVIGKDATFNGVEMKTGEREMLFMQAADLDQQAFAKPDSYDLERGNKNPIAYNDVVHSGQGTHIVRKRVDHEEDVLIVIDHMNLRV